MDKISSILPNNARVQATDMSESHPLRPGTPSFGRPVGNTVEDRITISNQKEAAAKEASSQNYPNSREAAKAKIAEDVTRRFFSANNRPSIVDDSVATKNVAEEMAAEETPLMAQKATSSSSRPEVSKEQIL